MTSIAVVYHSGYGHTKVQAEAVQRGASSVTGANATLMAVEDVEQNWDRLDEADAIIFGAPTYTGGAARCPVPGRSYRASSRENKIV